jgi:hypothetical protein
MPPAVDGLALVLYVYHPPDAVGGREFEVEVVASVVKMATRTAVMEAKPRKARRSRVEIGVTS